MLRRNCVTLALAAILAAGAGFGQTFTATVRGVVTDPTGSAVPGANLELKNTATNDLRTATSGAEGTYEFANLLPGTYEIAAQAAGFKQFVRTNLVVQAGVEAELNIPLELGPTSERVEVTAQAVLLDTESADHTATLDRNLVAALPTGTKTPLNFVFALAGTTEAPGGMTQKNGTTEQMFSMFSLQGGRSGNAQILLDGAPATALDWGGLMVSPTVEGVQEMQVVRNTYDAQYALGGGGIVSFVSKSGSTEFHGVAYEFLQNDNLNANTWQSNKNDWGKGEMKRNQFGVNMTGPIWKRRNLFFMGSYEGLRQPFTSGAGGYMTVPTLAERTGDFSKSLDADGNLRAIYDPASTVRLADGTYTRTPFSGNTIPSTHINAIGQKIVNLYGKPTGPGTGPTAFNNFYAQGKGNNVTDKVEGRVDWAQNNQHRIFARWTERIRNSTDPACFFCNGADSGWDAYLLTSPGWQATINDTLTPSPNWVINLLLGASRWAEGQTSVSIAAGLTPGSLGFNPQHFQVPAMPNISLDNYSGLGNNTLRKQVRYNHMAEVNVTRQMAKHTFRFGGNLQVQLINNRDDVSGSFSFSSAYTACDPVAGGACSAPNAGGTNGSPVASLLLGVGSGGSVTFKPDIAMSLHTYGAYFEDSWRVNRRLTLNLGLRYENQRPATERYNRMAIFNPHVLSPLSSQVPLGRPIYGGFEYASGGNRNAWDPNNKDFAPRVGLAYKLTDSLVARAGFGMFFGPSTAMLSFDTDMYLGFNSTTNWISSESGLGYIPTSNLSNPFPSGLVPITGSGGGLMTGVNASPWQIWIQQPHPTPYQSHFSFDLQYALKAGSVVEIGYTGWRARKLMYGNPDLNLVQLPTQLLSLGSKLDEEVPNPFYGILAPGGYFSGPTIRYNQLLRPFPQFGGLGLNRSVGGATANFDALNVKFQHQFTSGLNLLATYQYSKTMDNGSEDYIGWASGGSWRDSYNTAIDYSPSQHDVPHSFAAAFAYDLPFGRGKKFGSGAPAAVNAVVGGWQVASIIKLSSGMPLFTVVQNTWWNPLWNYGFPGNLRPNLTGNPKPANQGPDNWINAGAFQALNNDYAYGNQPRSLDSLRDSGSRNFDLSLAKTFPAERFNVQFRAEFLNGFNTPSFGNSNIPTCIDCGGLGQAWGTRNDPRMIQLGLRLAF